MVSQPKSANPPAAPGRADVGFLHTAEVHTATFDALAKERNLRVSHQVEEDWLSQAMRSGLTVDLRQQVENALTALADNCSIVICTCSTLGEVAASLQRSSIFRVDQPMMDLAAAESGPVYLAYCLDSTRLPSGALLQSAFNRLGRTDGFGLIDCGAAWPLFEQGESNAFGESVARQIVEATEQSAQSANVVLAQASMAAAQPWLQSVTNLQSLASPASALDHAVKMLG